MKPYDIFWDNEEKEECEEFLFNFGAFQEDELLGFKLKHK